MKWRVQYPAVLSVPRTPDCLFRRHNCASRPLEAADAARCLAAAYCALRSEYPGERVFWFLLVKGVRTYRYMSTLAQTFYPHWNGNVKEPELARLAAELAKDKFGSLYNPARGVVECPSAFGYLNRTMATVTDAQRSKPDVAFFLHKTRTMSAAMNWSACVKSLLIMWLNVISHCLKNPMLSSAMDNAAAFPCGMPSVAPQGSLRERQFRWLSACLAANAACEYGQRYHFPL